MSAQSSAERLYGLARKTAMNTAGGESAFWIIGATLRIGLVAQAILQTLYQQDEQVHDDKVRQLLHEMYVLLMDDERLSV